MVVTDRRVIFVTSIREDEPETRALEYGEIAAISVVEGSAIELSGTDGTVWQFVLPSPKSETLEAVLRHFEWVGEIRGRLVRCRNDVGLGAGEIRSYAEEMEWDAAESTYDRLRDRLDRLICAVQWTEPIDDEILAPELTSMERTLESAYARLYIEQANSQLTLGRQLVDNGDYEQARTVLRRARSFYETAKIRSEAVKRGDAFQFGTQRELHEDLERLGWEIETIAAEPLRQAYEATVRAKNTDDPTEAIHHWESALRRFDNVLTLEWTDSDQHFAGDRDKTREEIARIARTLVDLYVSRSEEVWMEHVESQRPGTTKETIRSGEVALSQLGRAAELARECAPDRAAEIRGWRDEMHGELAEMRECLANPAGDDSAAETDEGIAEEQSETDGENLNESSTAIPSIEEITSIDTHHEIALDLTDPGPADDEHHSTDDSAKSTAETETAEWGSEIVEQE